MIDEGANRAEREAIADQVDLERYGTAATAHLTAIALAEIAAELRVIADLLRQQQR